MKKTCKSCGHERRQHEEMKPRQGETITPCVNFEKDSQGKNISVCSCKDFVAA